jgi:hypothetical protein
LQEIAGQERNYISGPILLHDSRETKEPPVNMETCYDAGCCSNDLIQSDHQWDDFLYNNYFTTENPGYLQPFPDGTDLGEDRLLLPFSVFGFVLRSRKWAILDIELLRDVTYDNSWDDLVISDEHKEKVLALVESHTGKKSKENTHNMDLIQGKGKGLIILLHGEPGVGKTSTAECVADHTQRPLFPVCALKLSSKPEGIYCPII